MCTATSNKLSLYVSIWQRQNILKSQNEDLKLKMLDNDLQVVKKTKYFSLQIDSSLDWKELIKTVSTNVSIAVGFSEHVRSCLTKEILQTLYTGTVEPSFDTVVLSWAALV